MCDSRHQLKWIPWLRRPFGSIWIYSLQQIIVVSCCLFPCGRQRQAVHNSFHWSRGFEWWIDCLVHSERGTLAVSPFGQRHTEVREPVRRGLLSSLKFTSVCGKNPSAFLFVLLRLLWVVAIIQHNWNHIASFRTTWDSREYSMLGFQLLEKLIIFRMSLFVSCGMSSQNRNGDRFIQY